MLEKLKKYKEDKKKLEEMRKKQIKPAFKVLMYLRYVFLQS
jgi:hypothetical protein